VSVDPRSAGTREIGGARTTGCRSR
jgi:hypothetical protein